MPRYFFHLRKDDHPPDMIGVELDGLDAARIEASQLLGEELRDNPQEIWNDEEWHIEVTDEAGLILFTVYSTAIDAASTRTGSSRLSSP